MFMKSCTSIVKFMVTGSGDKALGQGQYGRTVKMY